MLTERVYSSLLNNIDTEDYFRYNFQLAHAVIRLIGIVLLSVYLIYFAVVAYSIISVTKFMKKAYKYLIVATIFVITASVFIA